MQAKAFLNRTYRIESRIAAKQERIRYWRELATSVTSSIENVGRSTELSRKVEKCNLKIMELEEAILRDVETLVATENEVRAAIESLQDIRYKHILEKRYLLHMSFEEIAVSEGYTYRWTQTLHKRALNYFEESMSIPKDL